MKTIREFWSGDRYRYDFKLCRLSDGWAQMDTSQDAIYFGTWVNPEKLQIVCYCEGDITTQTTENPVEFAAEIRKIKAWNEEAGHRFIGIDPGLCEAIAEKFNKLGLSDLLH
uniref:Uncharacterized protein n=1 Tax=viral metagenome TaxID=1070528 RepID=A0A6H2A4B3_9ZZZZ